MHPSPSRPGGDVDLLRRSLVRAERENAALRAKFALLSSTPLSMFAVDAAGVCTFAEGSGVGVLGLEPGSAVREDAPYIAWLRQAFSGSPVSTTCEFDGRIFEIWLAPERDAETGSITGVSGVAEDVTKRRRAEQERDRQLSVSLEASSALSRGGALEAALQECADALVNSLGVAFSRIWSADADGGLHLQAAAGLGSGPGGEPPKIPIAAYRVDWILENRARYVTNEVQSDPQISDREWARREGICSFAGYPLVVNEKAVGVLSVFDRAPLSDYTLHVVEALSGLVAQAIVRKQSEEDRESLLAQLEDQRSRLAAIIENAPVGIMLVEAPGGQIVLVNQRARSILRMDVEDMPDLSVYSGHVAIEREGRRLQPNEYPLARALNSGEATTGDEVLFHRGDGTSVWVRVSAVPIRDRAGRVVAAVNALADIETEKQAEQALRASNAELEQFAYIASHDLQEPLRMVTSYAQILARRYSGKLGPDADDFIGYIVHGAQRMQSLIEALLTYSRVIHAPNTPDDSFAQVPLERPCRAALFSVQKRLEEVNGRVEIGELPIVEGDDTQLAQVFQNLLSNALKYHKPDTPPVVRVSAERTGREWTISVADNGIGFDPKYAKKIFGVFKRLHGREVPGTGIGLAICQRVIERHGGRIWAESAEGRGATFRFTLPALN